MTQKEFEEFYYVRTIAMEIGLLNAIIGVLLHIIWQKLHGKNIFSWN
jgi:hypothetical protein